MLRIQHRREIPAASLVCTPEEAKWWEELRTAGNTLRATRGKKEKQRFMNLLQEGQEKGLQPPVADMKEVTLLMTEPTYNENARSRRINGTVILEAEFRADGFVGEVKIVRGLGFGLDENAAEAARKTVFLPAVRDKRFVSFRLHMEMSFNLY